MKRRRFAPRSSGSLKRQFRKSRLGTRPQSHSARISRRQGVESRQTLSGSFAELGVDSPAPSPNPIDDAAARFAAARAGSTEALGQLLDQFRLYLLEIANGELDAVLRNKVGPSDI